MLSYNITYHTPQLQKKKKKKLFSKKKEKQLNQNIYMYNSLYMRKSI